MTIFGIKLLDEIDLPEFPFPDLGRHPEGEEGATATRCPPRRAPKPAESPRNPRPARRPYH